MRRGSIALVVVVAMAMPAVALAGNGHHGRNVDCTNAAVCQYFEHVPGGGGPTSGGGDNGGAGDANSGAGGDSVLSPAAQAALAEHGDPGLKTAALADATAPPGVSSADEDTQQGAPGTLPAAGGDPQGGPQVGKALGHILGGADAGTGMGIAFPIILGVSLIAAILLGIRRRQWPEHA